MINVHILPIPDWGLRCPDCAAELAGMREHRCEKCGHSFNIRRLLGMKRPIPHLELTCEQCGYLLTGLMEERCPECGMRFSLREMLEEQSEFDEAQTEEAPEAKDHCMQKREPWFTGRERPMPDFGLVCARCGFPLVGVIEDLCPKCGHGFTPEAAIPQGGDWVNIAGCVPFSLGAGANTILYEAQIPYVAVDARLYGVRLIRGQLCVPRAFFFDALHALKAAQQPPPAYAQTPWTCLSCGEDVPEGFEICWNCSAPHPDAPRDEERA